MSLVSRFGQTYFWLDGSQAEQLSSPEEPVRTIEVLPPLQTGIPSTLTRFIKGVTEYQTRAFKLRNSSPVVGYEIHRFDPGRLRFQFTAPTARMERKIRTHLAETVPGTGFEEGEYRLPVFEDETIGIGVLTTRRKDVYPLETRFDKPGINSVATSLRRHAMRDTRFLIQVLFKPVAGNPVSKRLWHHDASKESHVLRQEKIGLIPWHDRDATPLEKQNARKVDEKKRSTRFHVSVRILVIGAGEYTVSRIKEASGGFNVYSNDETGQSFRTQPVRSIRKTPILKTAKAVRDRSLSQSFQLSTNELAALVSIPDIRQGNIRHAEP